MEEELNRHGGKRNGETTIRVVERRRKLWKLWLESRQYGDEG